CAVKGSTVTLPCTFTPIQSVDVDGRKVPIEIVSVRWCQKHLICQGSTPTVYDSDSTTNNPRYKYLGDKKGNCTLQITDIRKEDEETFRFRMEANNSGGHWTGPSGVRVSVKGDTMKITSSSSDGQVRTGESVTLFCSARCTFNQLKVTWFRDDHALSESGPALQLSSPTAKDSGNYTCGLQTSTKTRSGPYSLQVEAGQEELLFYSAPPPAGAVCLLLVLMVCLNRVLLVFWSCVVCRRRSAADQRAEGGEEDQKQPDHVYSRVLRRADGEAGGRRQESSRAVEEVSYASVQFQHKTQNQAEDATIYSSVASRG
uniref:Ig-like domain-containing protein n=1 Tax=Sparus aurata TaxID=8175 RepID=A0A671WW61_SPAAU